MATKPRKKAPKAPKSANPVGDFLKSEAQKRQLPVVTEKKPKTGNPNRANPPKVINQGHTPGSASRAVVPYKAPAPKASMLGKVARGLGTVGKIASGPVGFAIGMVADAKPAGLGSDKPPKYGMTLKQKAEADRRGTTAKASAKASSGQSASGSGSVAIKKAAEAPAATKATPVAKPKPKPATEAPKASQSPPKPKAKPSFSKGPADGKMSFKADNPVGNWKGAAATEMQKRGGARINRGGGLLGKLRGK